MPGATECQVCGEPIPSYGNASAVNQQAAAPAGSSAVSGAGAYYGARQYGAQSAGYGSQSVYNSQYGAQSAQAYPQTGSYGAQNGYYSQYGQQSQSASQAGSYGAQNGYYSQYGQQSQSASQAGSYGAQNGYYSQYGQQSQSASQAGSYGAQSGYYPQYGQQPQQYSQVGYGAQSGYYSPYAQQQANPYSYSHAGYGYDAQNGYYSQYAQSYGQQGVYAAMNGYPAYTQQYMQQSMNMYPAAMQGIPADKPIETAEKTFRSLVASPVFIICLILTCVSMILGTYLTFSGDVLKEHYEGSFDYSVIEEHIEEGSQLLDKLPVDISISSSDSLEAIVSEHADTDSVDVIAGVAGDLKRSPLSAVPLVFTKICSFGDKINLIPNILMLIGLWVAFGTVSSSEGIPFGTGGLTCIKVGLVFRTVLSCIIGGLIIIGLILASIAMSSLTEVLESIVGKLDDTLAAALGLLGTVGRSVILIVLAAFVTYFVLRCIYYAKQTKAVDLVSTTAAQGVFSLDLPIYVIFWNFVLAALHLATGIFFYGTPMLLVRHVANAAALVMISVSMILYRKKTSELDKASVPVVIKEASR